MSARTARGFQSRFHSAGSRKRKAPISGARPIQLWGACSNPEVVIELRRLADAAAALSRAPADRQPSPARFDQPRPGWVLELIVAVLASSHQPLRPQDVIRGAEQMQGRPIAPSSIRNALRVGSKQDHGPIERVRYGTYRLRRDQGHP